MGVYKEQKISVDISIKYIDELIQRGFINILPRIIKYKRGVRLLHKRKVKIG